MKNTAIESNNKTWRSGKSSSPKRSNSANTGSSTPRNTRSTLNRRGLRKRPWSGYSGKLRKKGRPGSSRKSRRNKKGKKLMMNLSGNRRSARKSTRSRATFLSKRLRKYRLIY